MSDPYLDRVREVCLALPEVFEKTSHGAPCFFIKKGKQLAAFADHHHGADFVALWVPQPDGAQDALLERDPAVYFVPPYVGGRGWIGVKLGPDTDWGEVAEVVEEGYRKVAKKTLVARLDAGPDGGA